MTADDISTPDISIRDLEQRWGLSRNGLKARAKALGVELIRVSSTCTVWPGDYIDLGDRLNEHISAGSPLGTFPGLAPVTDRPVPSRQQRSEAITASNEAALIAVVEAITASSKAALPAPDPLVVARRLAEAADLGVALTNNEMAQVLSRASIGPKQDGWSPRPGFTIHRQEHNGSPFWTVERSIDGKTLKQLDQAAGQKVDSGRQVGFAAHLTSNTSGVSLFAATTIC